MQLNGGFRNDRVPHRHIGNLHRALAVVRSLGFGEHQLVMLVTDRVGESHRARGTATVSQRSVPRAHFNPCGPACIPSRSGRLSGTEQGIFAGVPLPNVVVSASRQRHGGNHAHFRKSENESRSCTQSVQVAGREIAVGGVGGWLAVRRHIRTAGNRDTGSPTESYKHFIAFAGDDPAFHINRNQGPGVFSPITRRIGGLPELKHTIQIGEVVDLHHNPSDIHRFLEEIVGETHTDLVLI